SSISIQLGGILGIGLQGGIFSHWLMTDLDRTLTGLALPEKAQRELVAGAMRHFTEAAIALPHALSPQVFEAAIRQGFISGLHATLFVALGALLMGLGAIACFVPPKITPPDRAS
ncbi:MAG: hypothetical protein AAFY54_13625, partial [Cyanobacteria bacterium J06648_10]